MPPPPPMMETPLFMNNNDMIPPATANSVLNENDQKAFSQFLDQFFVDPNMQTMFDGPPPPPPPPMYLDQQQEEYYRQSSILQSLDEQKKRQITEQVGGGAIRRTTKPHKELLTEEEKRHNHIASEQKRRGMIRTGFKDLTEIVPTLKNINNSKSTVLFKAVDYIKYLEKRNKNLRDKIKNLEVRVEVEGKINILNTPHINTTNAALLQHKTQQKQLRELQEKLQLHQKLLAQQQTNVSA